MRLTAQITVLLFSTILSACTSNQKQNDPSPFNSDIRATTPWTGTNFDAAEDKFTFAVVSDLWGGYRSGVFDRAVEELNLLRPEFIMSIGDLIDGNSEDSQNLNEQWDEFDALVDKTIAPFMYVGGNHDLTNLTMRKVWENRYGHRYYHFVYKNVLFMVLDTEDYSDEKIQHIYKIRAELLEQMYAGVAEEELLKMPYSVLPEKAVGEISDQQSAYFESAIADNPDVRWTFVFMHKPVWQREDEWGLGRIEAALGEQPYTVFNGHEHRYSYHQKNGRDYIKLATTGGTLPKGDPKGVFDHITLITVAEDEPAIANIRLDGVLDKTGRNLGLEK